jgi:hypothetical protein
MRTSTTTTTGRKIATRKRAKSVIPPKTQKPYSRRELAAEVFRLTGESVDPGYLADIAHGNRKNERLMPAIVEAIANLEARASKASG